MEVGRKSEKEAEAMNGEGKRLKDLLVRAREGLNVETLFGKEYWKSDGLWAYEVEGKAGEDEVTFWEVAEQHPAIRKWMKEVRDEVKKAGIRNAEEGFSGAGEESGEARLEDLQLLETGQNG